ncbi:alpha/beta fold hydrolase [Paenibacillus sp.]|jgi:pimeloyl-ACP methyl ester carboxylesterase|uniref:alpha/beta fold hydrolase n=1 Tax=Paenibacillus sp. TaxID=58172 RepID=UPI002835278E|nr:alpha/beta fold hydrolase [Paenibacillus sp.]MDR0267956.1 alpha/beta fold hydrolase [Paenibacillus sp.]
MVIEKAQLIKVGAGPTDSRFSVIFVHGIGGDPYDTWRKDAHSKTLIELLKQEPVLREAEFYSYGYRTSLKPWQYDFKTVAELLYSDIQVNLPGKHIIFVAHSMGGLVVQQYIVNRYETFDEINLKAVIGAVYLSVPFHGSGLAELFPKSLANRQIKSLRRKNPQLDLLERNWNKYVYRGGVESLPENLKHNISQIALRGERDRVVARVSSTPLYFGAEVVAVDEGHSSICKVDRDSTVYKTIREFLQKNLEPQSTCSKAMIFYVHGYDKQQYEAQPEIELNWTEYFDAYTSPRKLPSKLEWSEMGKELGEAANYWSQNQFPVKGCVRIYATLCLPGGILIGSRFSQTRGAVIEVAQGGQIWSSLRRDPSYKVNMKRTTGNNSNSKRAIVVLSVTNDIENTVISYLTQTDVQYGLLINLTPLSGTGQRSIGGAEQAVSYAIEVKGAVDGLKQQGIEEIDLFLNCPLGVAVFVGHYLTAVSPIQVYDFMNPGYTPACVI